MSALPCRRTLAIALVAAVLLVTTALSTTPQATAASRPVATRSQTAAAHVTATHTIAAPTVPGTTQLHLPTTSDVVIGRAVPAAKRARIAAHVHVTSVLVILAYWGANHDGVTPAIARKYALTQANAYYRAASYGRQGITGTVTPWVRVPTFACQDFGVFGPAESAVRKLGFDPGAYGRVVVYEPCNAGFAIGYSDEPGKRVLLMSGGMTLPTAVHEQGHNYGLDHANLWTCRRKGMLVTYAAGSSCSPLEYYDFSSAMGLQWDPAVSGDFTAPQKAYLGWFSSGQLRTVHGSGSVTLSPYEAGRHTVAVKVPGSLGRTYWAEFRTPTGNDKHIPKGFFGVVLHLSLPDGRYEHPYQSLLLDPLPSSSPYPSETDHMALPVGSSWTSPDGVRFTVTAQSATKAVVRVSRGQHTRAPGSPSALKVRAGDSVAAVTFKRAADNGDVVHYYKVTASPGGRSATVRDYTSASTLGARIRGLKNGTRYRFTVAAYNESGKGRAATSAAVTPKPALPTVAISAPKAGASVSGLVNIKVMATPNATSRLPIDHIDVSVDGHPIGTVGRSGTVPWDTGAVGNRKPGKHTITARAVDTNHRAATRSETVTVTHTTVPGVSIGSPAAGTTVRGPVTVTGKVTRYGPDAISDVELSVDGQFIEDVSPSHGTFTFSWDSSQTAAGAHALKVVATDGNGRTASASRSVTVAHEKPVVTITAPAAGGPVFGATAIASSVTNNWASTDETIDVEVTDAHDANVLSDIEDLGVLARGATKPSSTPWDTSFLPPGSYKITVTVTDAAGVSNTVTRAVSVTHPKPTAAVTSPAANASVQGIVPIGVQVTNPSSVQDLSAQLQVTDAAGNDVFDDSMFYPAVAHAASGSSTSSCDTSSLTPGNYTISVTPTDASGTAGQTVARTVKVVHPGPGVTITSLTTNASVTGSLSVSVTLTNNYTASGVSLQVYSEEYVVSDYQTFDAVPGAGTRSYAPAPFDISNESPGPHTLTVVATDDYGVSTMQTVEYTVH